MPLDQRLVWDLLEAKDIAKLFELWCFFAVVEAVTHVLGTAISAVGANAGSLQMSVPSNLAVAWNDGTRVLYNATYSRRSLGGRRSYSVPLRPDLAIEVVRGRNAGLHLMDAKFRLDRAETVPLAEEGVPDEPWETDERERPGAFERADIHKMHTYRDAIEGVRSVWVLYPGTSLRFYSDGGAIAVDVERLPDQFDGVGAVPALPGGDRAELAAVVKLLLNVTPPS